MNHVGLHGAFREDQRFCGGPGQMRPAFCTAAVLLSHAGNPAELAFHGVVLSELETLNLPADVTHRDQDPTGETCESPIPVFRAKEARDPGQVTALVLELLGDRRMPHDRRRSVPKTSDLLLRQPAG